MWKALMTLAALSSAALGQEVNVAVRTGNWRDAAVWNRAEAPTARQKVCVDKGTVVTLRDIADIDQFALGDGLKTGVLAIDGGRLRASSESWVAVGYDNNAVLKVINGGRLETLGRMYVGLKDEHDDSMALLLLEGGTVRVNGLLELGRLFDQRSEAGVAVASRAMVRIMDGELEVDELKLSEGKSCRVNIAGGRLIITGDQRALIREYIEDGRLTSNNAAAGAEIRVEFHSGKTVVSVGTEDRSIGLLL